MYVLPRPTLRRLFGPDAVVITVVIVITAVLSLTGMSPVDALALTAGAGLGGAGVIRAIAAGPPRRAAVLLPPSFFV
ncbi:hypothetical protein [Streptomyces scopuliridis]|uniref:hypothetical protein n=1 Tax=Streptomyces scopuliridis TaxID=452529 RepID=UPI0034430628